MRDAPVVVLAMQHCCSLQLPPMQTVEDALEMRTLPLGQPYVLQNTFAKEEKTYESSVVHMASLDARQVQDHTQIPQKDTTFDRGKV